MNLMLQWPPHAQAVQTHTSATCSIHFNRNSNIVIAFQRPLWRCTCRNIAYRSHVCHRIIYWISDRLTHLKFVSFVARPVLSSKRLKTANAHAILLRLVVMVAVFFFCMKKIQTIIIEREREGDTQSIPLNT